jgi:MOSC domain-containing protein YiiM
MMAATIVALHVCRKGRHARRGSGRQVLLIDAETLEQFGLAPGDVREQVTVRGLDLNGLAAGTRLRVGGAVLELAEACAPCERMNEVRPGLMEAIDGRRGRFVRVLEAGSFAVGDAIEIEPGA